MPSPRVIRQDACTHATAIPMLYLHPCPYPCPCPAPNRFRCLHPRWENIWIQVGLLFGLYLIIVGALWWIVLGAMTHSEHPGFPLAMLGLVFAALGVACFTLYFIRAMHDSTSYECPVCEKKVAQPTYPDPCPPPPWPLRFSCLYPCPCTGTCRFVAGGASPVVCEAPGTKGFSPQPGTHPWQVLGAGNRSARPGTPPSAPDAPGP